MRTYPPYARPIARLLLRGKHPAGIGVMLSSKWRYFERAAKICISPDEWAFGRWEFGYLKGEHVVALWGDDAEESQFGELLLELMLAGPRLLWACTFESGSGMASMLYKDPAPDALVHYADQVLAKGKHQELARLALHCYEAAQLRELDLVSREANRAAELGREGVAFLRQREEARHMVELLFSDPLATADERAA